MKEIQKDIKELYSRDTIRFYYIVGLIFGEVILFGCIYWIWRILKVAGILP